MMAIVVMPATIKTPLLCSWCDLAGKTHAHLLWERDIENGVITKLARSIYPAYRTLIRMCFTRLEINLVASALEMTLFCQFYTASPSFQLFAPPPSLPTPEN